MISITDYILQEAGGQNIASFRFLSKYFHHILHIVAHTYFFIQYSVLHSFLYLYICYNTCKLGAFSAQEHTMTDKSEMLGQPVVWITLGGVA